MNKYKRIIYDVLLFHVAQVHPIQGRRKVLKSLWGVIRIKEVVGSDYKDKDDI